MKRLILSSLSVLLVAAATAPILRAEAAEWKSTQASTSTADTSPQLKPFNLVFLAYQGFFRDQGIPSHGALISAYEAGRITPKDLVQSAVKTNRLSSEVLNDRGYLRSVEAQLTRVNMKH